MKYLDIDDIEKINEFNENPTEKNAGLYGNIEYEDISETEEEGMYNPLVEDITAESVYSPMVEDISSFEANDDANKNIKSSMYEDISSMELPEDPASAESKLPYASVNDISAILETSYNDFEKGLIIYPRSSTPKHEQIFEYELSTVLCDEESIRSDAEIPSVLLENNNEDSKQSETLPSVDYTKKKEVITIEDSTVVQSGNTKHLVAIPIATYDPITDTNIPLPTQPGKKSEKSDENAEYANNKKRKLDITHDDDNANKKMKLDLSGQVIDIQNANDIIEFMKNCNAVSGCYRKICFEISSSPSP